MESASASARSDSATFSGQVGRARLGLLGEVRLAPRPRGIVGGLEAAPQHLALRARHVRRLLPLLLQLADLLGDLLGVHDRRQRFHLFAELFLQTDVGPPLPAGDVAQLLDFRREGGLRGLQPLQDVLVVALGRQRRQAAERRAHVAQRALAGFERQVGPRCERLDAAEQLLDFG